MSAADRTPRRVAGALAAALALSALVAGAARAQIERLTLAQMVARTDDCVAGRIVARTVRRVDHPVDGEKLYFTTLSIEGRSLYTSQPRVVEVTFAGGFVSKHDGVWNSEAPSDAESAVGAQVVAFFKWTDNMGGDVAANALYAAHGGLYRVVESRGRRVVLGRGAGYAIESNTGVDALAESVAELR